MSTEVAVGVVAIVLFGVLCGCVGGILALWWKGREKDGQR